MEFAFSAIWSLTADEQDYDMQKLSNHASWLTNYMCSHLIATYMWITPIN